MRKIHWKTVGTLVCLGLIGFSSTHAESITTVTIQAQINALLEQITQLQAQLKALPTRSGEECHAFTVNLRAGNRGAEVHALQRVLIKEGFAIPGISLHANDAYFGQNTAAAVIGFQKKYRDGVLTPAGLVNGTGYVGPLTREKLNQLYGCVAGSPRPPPPPPLIPIPPTTPSSSAVAPGPVLFTRAYYGSNSANQNRIWSWGPGQGGTPLRYWVQPSWASGFYTASTFYQFSENVNLASAYGNLDRAILKNGETHSISIQAENALGKSTPVMDYIKINYLTPDGADMGLGTFTNYFQNEKPAHITRLRYKFRIEESTNVQGIFKIIFTGHNLMGPKGGYAIEEDFFNFRDTYTHPNCEAPINNGINQIVRNNTTPSVVVDVSDYTIPRGKVGMKTFSPTVFPFWRDFAIDNAHDTVNGDTSRNQVVSQIDIRNKDIQVEISRAGIVNEKSGWYCDGAMLDNDTYREWNVMMTIDGTPYKMSFALPDSKAEYMNPDSLFYPVTEFFIMPGYFKTYYWDIEYGHLENTLWEKVPAWKVTSFNGNTIDYGVRPSISSTGKSVIELSNDAPNAYLPNNSIFTF